MRSNCGRDPIYQCDSCEKFFRSMGSLKCHKTIHSNVLDFECTFCLKRFRTKGQLTVHLRSHTKEKAFHCQYCPASFSHRESLITHNSKFAGFSKFILIQSTLFYSGTYRYQKIQMQCLRRWFFVSLKFLHTPKKS